MKVHPSAQEIPHQVRDDDCRWHYTQERHCGLDPQSPTPLEENKRLGQLIEALGNFDQLIYEQCDRNGNPRWIHVSWKRNGWNRHQILKR